LRASFFSTFLIFLKNSQKIASSFSLRFREISVIVQNPGKYGNLRNSLTLSFCETPGTFYEIGINLRRKKTELSLNVDARRLKREKKRTPEA